MFILWWEVLLGVSSSTVGGWLPLPKNLFVFIGYFWLYPSYFKLCLALFPLFQLYWDNYLVWGEVGYYLIFVVPNHNNKSYGPGGAIFMCHGYLAYYWIEEYVTELVLIFSTAIGALNSVRVIMVPLGGRDYRIIILWGSDAHSLFV